MARKQRPPEDGGTWMNTYSDLVTLLLCFFVLMYSMSSIDADKWQQFAQAMASYGRSAEEIPLPDPAPGEDDFPLPQEEEWNNLFQVLKEYTEEHDMEDSVQLAKSGQTIYIRFNNNVFFYPDRADLKPESTQVLDFLGGVLHDVEDMIYLININGHTASVDYQYYPVSSWTLSGERATNIAIFMESEKGIDPKKLRPIGYGDNYPIATNSTEEGRTQNRRVDMVIISNQSDAARDGGLYDEFAGLFDPDAFPTEAGMDEILTPPEGSTGGAGDTGGAGGTTPNTPPSSGGTTRPPQG